MSDHEFYYHEQTAKMREMEDASCDRTPLWDLGESCAERSARLDGSWTKLEAQYAWVEFCWEVWRFCKHAKRFGKLPDALKEDSDAS